MADENPTPVPTTTATATPQANEGGAPSNSNQADAVKMAEEMGQLKKENEVLKKYQERVDPVLVTLYDRSVMDEETFNKVLNAHNKRTGISPADDPAPTTTPDPANVTVPVSKESKDTRNWAITKVVGDFYSKHGIDKLTTEQKSEVDQNVSMVLRETLNPTGGKSLEQIMEDVPLDKLPDYLDKAYFWANRHEIEARAKEEGKREAMTGTTGIIGSMPSSGGSGEEVVLTQKEMEVIKKAGWSVDGYLKNKKELASRGNQIY